MATPSEDQMEMLTSICDELTAAETAFIELAKEWQTLVGQREANLCPPRKADEATLAALLLAAEHGITLGVCADRAVARVLEVVSARGGNWLDELPWSLARSLIGSASPGLNHLHQLSLNLNHHNSAVRMWMHEIAWMVRKHLLRETVTPILLSNLASQIFWVSASAGLLAELYEDKEALDAIADAFIPEILQEQYQSRLKDIQDRGWDQQAASLWLVESKCRERSWQAVALRRVVSQNVSS